MSTTRYQTIPDFGLIIELGCGIRRSGLGLGLGLGLGSGLGVVLGLEVGYGLCVLCRCLILRPYQG